MISKSCTPVAIPTNSPEPELSAPTSSDKKVQVHSNTHEPHFCQQFDPGYSKQIRPSRLAQRPCEEWDQTLYDKPELWNQLFYNSVANVIKHLKAGSPPELLLAACRTQRHEIERARGNPRADSYGKSIKPDSSWTPAEKIRTYQMVTYLSDDAYRYALGRVVSLKYDDKHFIRSTNFLDQCERGWSDVSNSGIREGYVNGIINDKNCRLTRFLFADVSVDHPLNHATFNKENRKASAKGITGKDECALMNHGLPASIPLAMEHIHQLIKSARAGNFNAIPRIHWWYVQLAPVQKGPGGIAEMLVTALCQYHNLTLPAWAEGVAPSIEVLLEPDEEAFCANYHTLFDSNKEQLKRFFATTATPDAIAKQL